MSGFSQDKGTADKRRTVCKVCRRGVFVGQPAQWSADPLALGIVHTACVPAPVGAGR
jgi:hypothetical protein